MLTNENSCKVVSLFYGKKLKLTCPCITKPLYSFQVQPISFEQVIWTRVFPFFLLKVLNYMVKIWSCEEELFHHKVHNDIKDVERLPPEFEKNLKSGSPFIYRKAGTGYNGLQRLPDAFFNSSTKDSKNKTFCSKQDFQCSTHLKKRNQSALSKFSLLTQAAQTIWAFVVLNSAL